MRQILPIPTDLNIEKFNGATIEHMTSYIENGIVNTFPNGKKYVTQRPSFTTVEDASAASVDAYGRGIYYWRLAGKLYICNYDTVYYDSYASACTGYTATGDGRVYWAELADKLFMLDVDNNVGYYIDDGTSTVLNAVTDAQFPDTSAGYTLAHGCPVLDGTMYLLANNANGVAYIWGSDLNDVTSWDALNFITATKNSDKGVYIGKHQNNIFVIGNESLEFFYNAGNATGSPLSARQDLSYNIGCVDGKSVFINNDEVFFVGKSTTSGIGVYKLSNFNLTKISSPSIDAYLTSCITNYGLSVLGSGVFAQGRTFYAVTVYENSNPGINPLETIVWNNDSNIWTLWEHGSNVSQFPLVQWVSANDVSGSTIYTGKGIFSNGDYVEVLDDFYANDRVAGLMFEATTFEDFVFSNVFSNGPISLTIQTGHIDFDTRNRKFMQELRPVCDSTEDAQTLNIQWTDDNHSTLTAVRTLDLSNANDKLTRLGQFRSRNFIVNYNGTEAIRLEGLEVEVTPAGV